MSQRRTVVAHLEQAGDPLSNIEAEASLLGAILLDNGIAKLVQNTVTACDFHEPLHGRIFEAVQSRIAAGQSANVVLLVPHFRDDPAILELGGINYLAQLTADGSGLLAAVELSHHLRDLADRRRIRDGLKTALGDIADLAADPARIADAVKDALTASPVGRSLPLIDLTAWATREPAEREWALRDWIPARQATYFTGAGSAGKSLLAQQLCTCIVMGSPFLGIPTHQAIALYVTCEDEADELERRQKAICRTLQVDRGHLPGRLHLVSLHGEIGNELAVVDKGGQMVATEAYRRLEATALEIGATFIALDNVAHIFAGDENTRSEVAAFVNLLNRLAQRIDGAVLFLGHPNKSGGQFSGSTAWENQVRSRIYLEIPSDESGTVLDADARVLSRQKSNYARNGARIDFRWFNWSYLLDEDLPEDTRAELADAIQVGGENELFLACLRERAKQGIDRAVGPKPGPNYAPSQFENMPQARGLKRAALKRAMERLYTIGRIESVSVRNTEKGRDVTIIQEVGDGAPNSTPNLSRTGSPNSPEQSARTTPNTHPIDYVYTGAAEQAAAPDHDVVGRA